MPAATLPLLLLACCCPLPPYTATCLHLPLHAVRNLLDLRFRKQFAAAKNQIAAANNYMEAWWQTAWTEALRGV